MCCASHEGHCTQTMPRKKGDGERERKRERDGERERDRRTDRQTDTETDRHQRE